MKEIKLQNNTYLFVECDNDSHSHSLTKFKTHAVINYKRDLTGNCEWSDNIGGLNIKLLDYEIISTTKDITEEKAHTLMEYYHWGKPYSHLWTKIGANKEKECWWVSSAKESLKSLIQANGLDVNKNYLILLKK